MAPNANAVVPFRAPVKEKRDAWVGSKLTVEEYKALLEFSGGHPLDSEWVRHALLTFARRRKFEESVMAEVLATRTLIANLIVHLASGKKLDPATMPEFVSQSRENLTEKARTALDGAE